MQARARHHRAEGQTIDRVRAPIRQWVLFAFSQCRVLPQSDLLAGHDFCADQISNLIAQSAEINEFEQGGALNRRHSLRRIAHAGQFNQDPVASLHLHGRLGQSKRVHPSGDIVRGFAQIVQREVVQRCIGLQQNAQAADEVEAQALRDVQYEFVFAIAVRVDFQIFAALEIGVYFGCGAGFRPHAFERWRRRHPDAERAQQYDKS